MKIETKLKTVRKKTGLTQVQVAEKAKTSERNYQAYEAGERLPNIQTALLIAKTLNSTCEKLFKKE